MSETFEPPVSANIARKIEDAPPHVRVGLEVYERAIDGRKGWHRAVWAAIDAAIAHKNAELTMTLPLPFDCGGLGCDVQPCICPDDVSSEATMLSPLLKAWRTGRGFAVLRLLVDIVGAYAVPVRRVGDLVYATWWDGEWPPLVQGWLIHKVPFTRVLNEPDVEVVERP